MSRKVVRVSLDFSWPYNKPWEGRCLPDSLHGTPCVDCKMGQTHAGWWLQHLCQRLEMLAADVFEQQRGKQMHPWLVNDPYPPTDSTHLFERATRVLRPSEDWLALMKGLTGVEPTGDPFGGGWKHNLYGAIAKAAGIPDFGSCDTCEGEGSIEQYPGQFAERDAWEPSWPEPGEGWQLWETTSEGSPVSPVFASAEELAEWLTTSEGGRELSGRPMTIDQALAFVDAGSAPTGFITAGGVHDGAEYVGTQAVLDDMEKRLGGES